MSNPVIQTLRVIGTTGIIKTDNNLFSIYPNPSNGRFSLRLLNENPYDIVIIDILGKIVYESFSNHSVILHIDLSNCLNGVYLLKIQNDSESLFEKIIIQNK